MSIVNPISLESNKQIKINWNGGDLSSDGGLLLIKEFAAKIGLDKLVKQLFKTNDRASFRFHTDTDNLMQVIYQIPLLKEYRMKYPAIPLYLRGDSGFASPDLYETCAEYDCKYAIRLKQNQTLIKYVADAEEPCTGRHAITRLIMRWSMASLITKQAAGLIREGVFQD